MKIKVRRLRGYVIPSIFVFLISVIFYSGYKIWNILESEVPKNDTVEYVTSKLPENIKPTINEEKIIRPYVDSTVEIAIPYYNSNNTKEEQESALIYFENIYMQNTGVMYSSDNKFDCIAILDGKVKNIKDDTIMGKIVEVEYNNNITIIYQSLTDVSIEQGQSIKQGDLIGSSNKNEIVGNNKYCIHIEVFKNGELINPEEFYNMSIEEINE